MDAGLIPDQPRRQQSAFIALPYDWCGTATLDGTIEPWSVAPLGSRYTLVTAGSVTLYVKKVSSSATSDWKTVTTS